MIGIEHIALWTTRLEEMREFYCTYFEGTSNDKYVNTEKGFQSYFITFHHGARLEIMSRTDINQVPRAGRETIGITHIAFRLGGSREVDRLTQTLREKGYHIAGEPRTTGDGYYESVILDPEGNRIELVA